MSQLRFLPSLLQIHPSRGRRRPSSSFFFAGDENRTAEHDTDVLRDFESTRAVCALGNPRVASTQCNIGTRQERRSGPAH